MREQMMLKPTRNVVWKYTLTTDTKPQSIEVPGGGSVLSIQFQGDELRVWMEVCPDDRHERRTFIVRGTGQQYMITEDHYEYHRATVHHGSGIWHVFEVEPTGDE